MVSNGTAFRYKPLPALGLETSATPTQPSAGLQSILAALHDATPRSNGIADAQHAAEVRRFMVPQQRYNPDAHSPTLA